MAKITKTISLFCFSLVFVVYFCNFSQSAPKKTTPNIKSFQNKTLTLAMSNDFPPFDTTNDKGETVGIDVDILNEITKRTGIKFKLNIMAFNTIIAGINAKKVDGAISGMTITEDRKQNVDFSIPYYKTTYALIYKKSDNIKTIKDLEGQKVGSQTGTMMYDFLEKYNKTISNNKDKMLLSSIDENSVGIQALRHNKIKAYLLEELQGKAFCAKHQDLAYIQIKDDVANYAIAFQKGSPYKHIIDIALKDMLKDGTITKIIDKWENQQLNKIQQEEKQNKYKVALFGITKGALTTLQYTIASICCGLILSLLITLLLYSGNIILTFLAKGYVSIIRGTPLLLQLSFVYFGFSQLFHLDISIFVAGVISFSINSSAYLVEIIRSGVRSIDKGQIEACRSLNLSKYQTIKDVMIPQVLHNIFPSLINEFIALIKESSIISIFGGYDIMKKTNLVIAEYYTYFLPLMVAGLTYYTMTFTLERLSKWWEKRYKY